MVKGQGISGGKIVMIVVFLLLIGLGLWLAWREFGQNGILPGPSETVEDLKNKVTEAEQRAEDAEKAKDQAEEEAEGLPTAVFWGLIVSVLILLFIFATTYGQVGGKNIDREQAKNIATKVLYQDYGWRNFFDAPGSFPVWVQRTVHTGQAVEGDNDSLWYLVEFAQDFPEGGGIPPGHQCITILIKSNDAGRQIHAEIGLNARESAVMHKIRLQKSPQPSNLATELSAIREQTDLFEQLGKFTGDE